MNGIIIEAVDMTPERIKLSGMVRCCDCLNIQPSENGARRCRLFWRPAMVPDKWRRCKWFDRMNGK